MFEEFEEKSFENSTIRPANVEISFFTLCGSSKTAFIDLKLLTTVSWWALYGSKYFERKTADKMDFNIIVFPPAFTPVIITTDFVKSMLIGFGLCNAG